jgi:hypothetical protein
MVRFPTALCAALLVFYGLQVGVLTPLHLSEEAVRPPSVLGFAFGETCDPEHPCQNPAHHHHPGDAHRADHCAACMLAARTALAAETPLILVGSDSIIILSNPAIEVPTAVRPDLHAPRGPPALSAS